MSIIDSFMETHYDGECESATCSMCQLDRGEITQEEFDELTEDI